MSISSEPSVKPHAQSLRGNKRAQNYHERLVSKYGKAKALSIIAQKPGRTVYIMLKRQKPYDPNKFFQSQ